MTIPEFIPTDDAREKYGMASYPDTARRIVQKSADRLKQRKEDLEADEKLPERIPHTEQQRQTHEQSMVLWRERYAEEVIKHDKLVEFLKPVTG